MLCPGMDFRGRKPESRRTPPELPRRRPVSEFAVPTVLASRTPRHSPKGLSGSPDPHWPPWKADSTFPPHTWLAEGASRDKRCPGIKAEPPTPARMLPSGRGGGALPQRDSPGTQGEVPFHPLIKQNKKTRPSWYLAGPECKY